jgi:hypothetical protein
MIRLSSSAMRHSPDTLSRDLAIRMHCRRASPSACAQRIGCVRYVRDPAVDVLKDQPGRSMQVRPSASFINAPRTSSPRLRACRVTVGWWMQGWTLRARDLGVERGSDWSFGESVKH